MRRTQTLRGSTPKGRCSRISALCKRQRRSRPRSAVGSVVDDIVAGNREGDHSLVTKREEKNSNHGREACSMTEEIREAMKKKMDSGR